MVKKVIKRMILSFITIIAFCMLISNFAFSKQDVALAAEQPSLNCCSCNNTDDILGNLNCRFEIESYTGSGCDSGVLCQDRELGYVGEDGFSSYCRKWMKASSYDYSIFYYCIDMESIGER